MKRKSFVKQILAAACCAVMLLSVGCQTNKGPTDSGGDTGGRPVNARVPLDMEKTYTRSDEGKQRFFTGTFLQSWYCSGWGDGRWESEMQNMVDNGMTYLIVPCAAYKGKNSNTIGTYFPSNVKDTKCSSNMIDTLFAKCKKYGIKVFLAPYADDAWYSKDFGWTKHHSVDDRSGQWAKEYTSTSNALAQELYDQFKSKYPETFYGWYYSDEMWNMSILCKETDETRDIGLDIVASAFNGVLDFYTKLDPSMPLLLSPFCNRSMSTAEEAMNMWIDLFSRIRFRKGDIFCPQDSIGSTPSEIDQLDEWTRAYRQAADTKPELVFWMNNENFAGNNHSILDRVKKQIDITSKYCDVNVTFSWQHHYSPFHENVNKGYEATYHNFYTEGKLESEKPTPPKVRVEKSSDAEGDDSKKEWTIYFEGSTDNIGVAGFYVYRGSENNLVKTALCGRSVVPNKYIVNRATTYWVQAYDFAGNCSEKVKVVISE